MVRPNLKITDAIRRKVIETRAEDAMLAMNPTAMASAVQNTSRFNGRGDLSHPGYRYSRHDGEKYEGGLGPIELLLTDYWSLRRRSNTFFKKNLYARGIIRRLVGNIVNTGLTLAASPNASVIGMSPDAADQWAEDIDAMFESWAELPQVCDYSKRYTFGQFQRVAKAEALISGDVLVIEHHNADTGMPSYELVDGALVQTPYDFQSKTSDGIRMDNGVEIAKNGEHIAFHIVQSDLSYKRIKAKGENNRQIAWMIYGTDKRHSEARGEPLLTLVMQNVAEIDKYRDATQRKASVGAQLVAFIQRSENRTTPGSRPFSSGASRRIQDTEFVGDGTERRINMSEMPNGYIIEGLADGEEIKGFNNDTTDEKFGEFEEAILRAVAWSLGMPYSVLAMQFDSSYSASRGEIKEFESVINETRDRDADTLLRPIYRSWLRAAVLTRRIDAPGFLPAARNPQQYHIYASWTRSQWYGMVKEAVDLAKETMGRKEQISMGALTRTKAARMLTGTDFKNNVRRLGTENQLLAEAMRPILEMRQEFGDELVDEELNAIGEGAAALTAIEGGKDAVVN